MGAEREMTLDEWCGRLPPQHAVNKELATIRAHIEALEGLIAEQRSTIGALTLGCEKYGLTETTPIIQHIGKAEARVRELEANDRRYRWLRDDENQDAHEMYVLLERLIPAYLTADDLDAAIDSAMQGEEVRGG